MAIKIQYMKGKRGQGLSMNTIVIAVIVLFVMVVLLLIFTGRISLFGSELRNCPKTGGYCSQPGSECKTLEGNKDWKSVFSDINNDNTPEAVADKAVDDSSKIGCGTGFTVCCRGIGAGKST